MDLEFPRGIRETFRLDLEGEEFCAGKRRGKRLLQEPTPFGGLPAQEGAAPGIVVNAAEAQVGSQDGDSAAGYPPRRFGYDRVRLGRHDAGGPQVFAVRTRHEIGPPVEIGGQQILAGLVRRVHEDVAVFPVRVLDSDDRMVEVGGRDFGVHLLPDLDKHRVGLIAGDAEEGDEQSGLVAADAVAVVEGDVHVMRRIAGGLVFHREPHVAHFLRDKVVDLAHVASQFRDFVRHGRRRFRQMRRAQPPIPRGKFPPRGECGSADALDLRIERGHVGLGEDLGRIRGDPRMHDRPVRPGFLGGGHIAQRMAHRLLSERQGRRGGHADRLFQDRQRPGHLGEKRELVLHARGEIGAHKRIAKRLADLQAGDGAGNDAVERIVDVGGGGRIVRRLAHRRRNIHRAPHAVRADDADVGTAKRGIAFGVGEALHVLFAAAFLGQNLERGFFRRDIRAVGLVGVVFRGFDQDGVRIRIACRRDLLPGGGKDGKRAQEGREQEKNGPHRADQGSIAPKSGCFWSFSDSFTGMSRVGQTIFRAGSSNRTPRSDSLQ